MLERREYRIRPDEVQVDHAIRRLRLVLNEQTDLDVLILVELGQLLLDLYEVIGIELIR